MKAHAVAPCVLYEPALHGKHTADEFAPIATEKVPATQGVHVELSAAPTKVLKDPAQQGKQAAIEDAPVALLNVPARQFVGSTDDKGQNEPIGQMTGAPDEQK